jgi:hypothetical protein
MLTNLSASVGKKVSETPISTNEPGTEASTCDPSYGRGISRRISVGGQPRDRKPETIPEK